MANDKREIVDAKADSNGDITHVLLEGNTKFTSVKKAIEMAKDGKLSNAHAVKATVTTKEHLRTNPDTTTKNNLDDMAGDT